MTIIEEVMRRLNCSLVKEYCDSNGYQGCDYYLVTKDGKYSLGSFAFGTCALCDTYMALTDEWLEQHPETEYHKVPLEAYEWIIKYIASEITECGWCTKEQLINKLHMLIGVGYSDTKIENQIREDLSRGS